MSSSSIENTWDDFEQKVGWRKKKLFSSDGEKTNPSWIDENSFDFNSSRQGYLPYMSLCRFDPGDQVDPGNQIVVLTHPPSDGLPRRLIYLGWRLRNCQIK